MPPIPSTYSPRKFPRCSGCCRVVYCSKERRKNDWPAHISACKEFKSKREYHAEGTGIATTLEDVWAWVGYYNAFLKNCAISSALLPLRSYAESKEFLCVTIMHTGQMDISVHPQFKVESVACEKVGNHKSIVDFCLGTYAKTERMGKIELKNNFFGVLSYVVLTVFNDTKGDPATVYSFSKQFSIDKRTAGANMLQLD
ncbi:hypothetical protein PM082_022392 [Marasmius tenuissimus]|nr:hypothetical protein PM082_022392 [Marasmius tenuissimus]